MINLVILVILAACAAGMYLKGTLVQAVIMIFNAIIAGFAALAFYEFLAVYIIKYVGLALWAPLIGYLVLFVLVFALLQTAALQIHKEKTDTGMWPERIGRAAGGMVLGYLLAGNLLIAVAMAPIPSTFPYPRFGDRNPNVTQPTRPLLSPDGFVTGLFDTISQGSFCAINEPRSFGMLHAGFIDSLYLNRLKPATEVSIASNDTAIETPRKGSVWEAPATLKDSEGQAPTVPGDRKLMIVRMSIKKQALTDSAKFTFSQCRVVCAPRGLPNPLLAKGQSIYPIGYVEGGRTLVRKALDDVVTLASSNGPSTAINVDLAYAVPSDMVPVLISFKRNNIEQLPAPVAADEAPAQGSSSIQSSSPAGNGQAPQTPPGPGNRRGGRGGGGNRGGRGNSDASGLSGVSQNASGLVMDPEVNP
jgi:hypothetical protein